MANGRHSYVRFYSSDWLAGTARMNRTLRSMYFDVCVHNWDHAEAMSRAEQALVFSDVPDWKAQVQTLLEMGKVKRTKGGGLYSERALNEALSSLERYRISVASGKDGAAKRWGTKGKMDSPPIREPVANQNQNQNLTKEKEKPVKRKSAWAGGDPPVEWLDWAEKNMGWRRGDAKREAQRFIDSAMANQRTYADWPAAWRQWCRSPFQKTVAPTQEGLSL